MGVLEYAKELRPLDSLCLIEVIDRKAHCVPLESFLDVK